MKKCDSVLWWNERSSEPSIFVATICTLHSIITICWIPFLPHLVVSFWFWGKFWHLSFLWSNSVNSFQGSTQTHCEVDNFAPSISAAIGNYLPQKYVWQTCVALHISPRFLFLSPRELYALEGFIVSLFWWFSPKIWGHCSKGQFKRPDLSVLATYKLV